MILFKTTYISVYLYIVDNPYLMYVGVSKCGHVCVLVYVYLCVGTSLNLKQLCTCVLVSQTLLTQHPQPFYTKRVFKISRRITDEPELGIEDPSLMPSMSSTKQI